MMRYRPPDPKWAISGWDGEWAGGGPGLMSSPKQRATQKLRPVLPGHPGMLCRIRRWCQRWSGCGEEHKFGGGRREASVSRSWIQRFPLVLSNYDQRFPSLLRGCLAFSPWGSLLGKWHLKTTKRAQRAALLHLLWDCYVAALSGQVGWTHFGVHVAVLGFCHSGNWWGTRDFFLRHSLF